MIRTLGITAVGVALAGSAWGCARVRPGMSVTEIRAEVAAVIHPGDTAEVVVGRCVELDLKPGALERSVPPEAKDPLLPGESSRLFAAMDEQWNFPFPAVSCGYVVFFFGEDDRLRRFEVTTYGGSL